MSASADITAFYSKKATFGGSYPRCVIAKFCRVGAYYNGIGFIGMNLLGITSALIGYVGIIVIA